MEEIKHKRAYVTKIRQDTVYLYYRAFVNLAAFINIAIGVYLLIAAGMTEGTGAVITGGVALLMIVGGAVFREAAMIPADIADMFADSFSRRERGDGE